MKENDWDLGENEEELFEFVIFTGWEKNMKCGFMKHLIFSVSGKLLHTPVECNQDTDGEIILNVTGGTGFIGSHLLYRLVKCINYNSNSY